MPKILLKGRPYGGSTTVTDALHLLTKDTLNTDVSAQNMLTNILGDIAQLETSTAATKAYAKGEYLVLGSYFYKVTATIDPGDTLTVGTNIEQTNVGAEMKKLITVEEKSFTLSTSAYSNYYYADVNVTSTENILSATVIQITSNTFAHCQIVGQTIRVYGTSSGAIGNIRIVYKS